MTPITRALLHCALIWHASQYSPNVMREVRDYRQLAPIRVDGYIAAYNCAAIGQVWWMRPVEQSDWESFQVVDCAAPDDGAREWMIANRIIAEVDHPTAVRWDTVGRGIYVQIKGKLKTPALSR